LSSKEKYVFATDAISKSRLPAEMKDRDRFVGVRLVRSGRKGRYFQARFSIPKTLLSEIASRNGFRFAGRRRTDTLSAMAMI
jgi:hypothetical protein